ncbi:hypothetical protein, partial [Anaerotignum sp.]|uniref:hypothetical protein n=1 Tax=Anaerotignum sp. TaxID=2039241 RepID=UPI00399F99F9
IVVFRYHYLCQFAASPRCRSCPSFSAAFCFRWHARISQGSSMFLPIVSAVLRREAYPIRTVIRLE